MCSICNFPPNSEVPEPPANKPYAAKVFKDMINLVWPGTTYDGGSIVTGYQVEMCEDGKNNWKVLTKNVFSTSYAVKGLKEKSTYKFRVSCINAVGTGKPSIVSEPIVASDRKGGEFSFLRFFFGGGLFWESGDLLRKVQNRYMYIYRKILGKKNQNIHSMHNQLKVLFLQAAISSILLMASVNFDSFYMNVIVYCCKDSRTSSHIQILACKLERGEQQDRIQLEALAVAFKWLY